MLSELPVVRRGSWDAPGGWRSAPDCAETLPHVPDYEAAEDEHDRRDHIMWLNGFKNVVWEVTRAQLRAADFGNLRNIADNIFGLDVAAMSRTAMIDYSLAHKEEFRWNGSA